MDALKEQDDVVEEEATPTPAAPTPKPAPAAAEVVKTYAPPKPAAPPSGGGGPSAARSDLYAKKMSELLLKGWKMLGENCPETGDVPLMQHPSTGRKFSIATGRYTDEPKPDSDAQPLSRLLGG